MPHYAWYYLVYILPLIAVVGFFQGGWVLWFTPFWSFIVVPVLDHVRGTKTGNVKPEREGQVSQHPGYNLVVWMWVPFQILFLAMAIYAIATQEMTLTDFAGVALTSGIITGSIGITWAHELCHRTSQLERAMAEILLTSVSYPHFSVEHVYGHHRNVATPKDPATSRLGESFYRFLPRTVIGSLLSAIEIERREQKKKKRPFWNVRNRMLRYLVVQMALYAGLYVFFGFQMAVFFAVQAIVAISLLELINYLEHYGLLRQQDEAGRYERVQPWHSWNASNIVSNLSLINLARHSDHHFMASRRYQILRHYDEAPQLPSGYAAMLMIALVPPIWFWIMNPRVSRWRETHLQALAAAGD